ncbi:alpha/beta hydrolase family protein [Paenibacillus nasutitermitis]|uniref:Alpha/beta hydrolase n=1 Tax=Paenibacillus nasutitermitis TaxID=1652958 RepID=A0A916YPR3_9BACL|nr:alpha/beta hydrolase [Paenibacillus nasutitermitis]GGD54134.1 hypothetical protein GCM10010911_09610 [Paenibacillus nasutitermitis]
MEMEIRPVRRNSIFIEWLLNRIYSMFDYDTRYWRYSLIGPWLACSAMLAAAALGMPTGFGVVFDTTAIFLLGSIGLALGAVIIAFILSLCYLPLPRFYAGALLFTGMVIYVIWYYADAGTILSLILSLILTLAGTAAGLLAGLLASRQIKLRSKLAVLLTGFILCMGAAYWPWQDNAAMPALAQEVPDDAFVVPSLEADNPAKPGHFSINSFTYGSGEDLRRDEFGESADLVSQSVDASAYISHWPWLRSFFWGFDETALPLNGRVWMPEGAGPFPLVLIVHGNHLMEQFSDEGYEYLGELLASRGFIAVSVDENFLNYSVWADIPNQDMKVRAWILLQHLQQIAVFNKQEGNPFYNKVDLQQVGLIGHSRGGQAAAMAADPSKWFASDTTLNLLDDIEVQAVIGIAPTDKTVDKQLASLDDIYYLTLQGANDGDVDTFTGERQYIRSTFTPGSERFKASLYIARANHSRFNSDWGTRDDSLPGGLLLTQKGMMDAADQQQIAKVYVSALMEVALHGNTLYKPLFSDYRVAGKWLPEAAYTSRFEDGSFKELARFDDASGKLNQQGGVTVQADDLKWSKEDAEDRNGNGKGTKGAVLEWKEQEGGSYTLELDDSLNEELAINENTSLVFSMSNLEQNVQGGDESPVMSLPFVDIQLESRDGVQVKLALDRFLPVVWQPHAVFTIASWLENGIKDGKYKESTQPVFQTYRLPLAQFQAENPQFEPSQLSRITFFLSGSEGKIMLDDIGIDEPAFS